MGATAGLNLVVNRPVSAHVQRAGPIRLSRIIRVRGDGPLVNDLRRHGGEESAMFDALQTHESVCQSAHVLYGPTQDDNFHAIAPANLYAHGRDDQPVVHMLEVGHLVDQIQHMTIISERQAAYYLAFILIRIQPCADERIAYQIAQSLRARRVPLAAYQSVKTIQQLIINTHTES